jgi:hypothetical protein
MIKPAAPGNCAWPGCDPGMGLDRAFVSAHSETDDMRHAKHRQQCPRAECL